MGRVASGRVTMRMAHRAMAVWLTVCGAIARGRGSVVVARRAGARRRRRVHQSISYNIQSRIVRASNARSLTLSLTPDSVRRTRYVAAARALR